MKKFWIVISVIVMMTGLSFADEAVLFDATAKADVLGTGYDWIENAKAVPLSGWYIVGVNPSDNRNNGVLSNPKLTEKYGLAIRADNVPDTDSNYGIEFITPYFNRDDSGEPISGTGLISNAAAIKSMEIVLTLNRGYDEVRVVWMQGGKEHSRLFKTSHATSTPESMVEFTAHIDFTEYVDDVRNRPLKQYPVAGIGATDIQLKRIQVTTHRAPGNWYPSSVSIMGIKSIKVIYDKAVTPEAYERGKEADGLFDVKTSQVLEDKTRRKIEVDIRQTEYNKSLMATEGTEDAK